MIQALNTAASGIQVGLSMLDRAAHNVANSQSEGYERSIARGTTSPGGTVTAEVVPGVDDGLAADIVQSIIAKNTVSANAAMFRRVDGVIGDMIDMLG